MSKICIIIGLLAISSYCNAEGRLGKAFSVFNIVKFANDACAGSDSKNGTCYTEAECSDKGGKASGSCAEGYGVCCVFTLGCGGAASENCTYFESSGTNSGACNAKICKCNTNICQIRLDLDTFVIEGPTTVSTSVSKVIFGHADIAGATGKEAGIKGRCTMDTFAVSVPGGASTSVICGTNSGEHLYIDAVDDCAQLSFQLSDASTVTRKWAIKILQYNCEYENLAPKGCLQYFFGNSGAGTVKTFNFDGSPAIHLANQNQNICVRRESGNCQICWSHAAGDFDVSSAATAADKGVVGKSGLCCGYGTDGMKSSVGYDCVIIAGAEKATGAKLLGSNFCGRALASETSAAAGKDLKTVCSKATPFSIRFVSDSYEFGMAAPMEIARDNKGFKLSYKQNAC